MQTQTIRSREEVLQELEAQGKTITQVAKELGVSRLVLSHLLHGRIKGRWGGAHRAAVRLGLKVGVVGCEK